MTNLQAFSFESNEIRVIEVDNEPYFVGRDVALVLGYSDTSDAIRNHVDEDDKRIWRFTGGAAGEYSGIIINESGLYSLILKSRLPQAKNFKKWITKEVIPSIRKKGYYIAPTNNQDILLNALADITSKLNKIETDYSEQIKKLSSENEKLNRVYEEYPGLKEAINYFMDNIDNNADSFSLKEYLLTKPKLQLDRGQRVSIGQLVSSWLKIATNCNLVKVNGMTMYQTKHVKLLDLAARYVQQI